MAGRKRLRKAGTEEKRKGARKARTKASRPKEGKECKPKRTPLDVWRERPDRKAVAVKAKCWDCCGGQRVEVRKCPAVDCPLWFVRPYQTYEESMAALKAAGREELARFLPRRVRRQA